MRAMFVFLRGGMSLDKINPLSRLRAPMALSALLRARLVRTLHESGHAELSKYIKSVRFTGTNLIITTESSVANHELTLLAPGFRSVLFDTLVAS